MPDFRRHVLEVVVTEVESTQRFHHEEVRWERLLGQVVVSHVEDFENGKSAEATRQDAQSVHAKNSQSSHMEQPW